MGIKGNRLRVIHTQTHMNNVRQSDTHTDTHQWRSHWRTMYARVIHTQTHTSDAAIDEQCTLVVNIVVTILNVFYGFSPVSNEKTFVLADLWLFFLFLFFFPFQRHGVSNYHSHSTVHHFQHTAHDFHGAQLITQHIISKRIWQDLTADPWSGQ